jgi:hypothetical protein
LTVKLSFSHADTCLKYSDLFRKAAINRPRIRPFRGVIRPDEDPAFRFPPQTGAPAGGAAARIVRAESLPIMRPRDLYLYYLWKKAFVSYLGSQVRLMPSRL